jgi:hypothetical protein
MKETIFKSLFISFFLTNIWTIFAFFDYLFEEPGLFYGFGTLVLYLWSCWIIAGLGIISIIITYVNKSLSAKQKLFILIMTITLNAFYTVIFIILSILKLIRVESFIELFLIANLLVSIASFLIIKKYKLYTKTFC